MTRIEYWNDPETPDNTGWYICHYGTVDDMLAKSPEDVIGPYETEAEAKRIFTETSDTKEPTSNKVTPYDPTRNDAPVLDAGIPTDSTED